MRVLKFGQTINAYVQEHAQKQGTPTMGGWMLVAGVIVGAICVGLANHLWGANAQRSYAPLVAILLVFLGHVAIGFADDYLSIKRGKNLGLKAREKLLAQFIVAGAFVAWLWLTSKPEFTTEIWLGRYVNFGVWYYLIALLLIMGMSNATNLTDGLDGLAGGVTVIAAVGLSSVLCPFGSFIESSWFCQALAGACMGFLCYNAYPAKIFMGDTGSLGIGASLAAAAIVGKQELMLLLFGLVFIMEMASVMIQVSYFKLTRGKRVFMKTPIHHHFQMLGWPETVVVARFLIVGVLAMVVGLMIAPRLFFSVGQ